MIVGRAVHGSNQIGFGAKPLLDLYESDNTYDIHPNGCRIGRVRVIGLAYQVQSE